MEEPAWKKAKDWRAYEPDPEQMRLWPETSGNAINGLGEEAFRRPTPIYWHYPEDLENRPFGPIQLWMLQKFDDYPELKDFHRRYGGRGTGKPVPIAEVPVDDTPANWTAQVKDFARAHEADQVGITALDPDWIFEGYEADYPWVIVLAVAMDYPELAKAPEVPSVVEMLTQYNRGTRAARALANWIHGQGYKAKPHGGPPAGPMTMIPAAIAAGLGELGKHGSMINRTFGSSFRLACVLTDLPLVADEADEFGADDFCGNCHVCTSACPPGAIFETKQPVRGTSRWYVDFDKCIPFFNETQSCGICIAVCPWSRPGTAPRLAEKMLRRRQRRAD